MDLISEMIAEIRRRINSGQHPFEVAHKLGVPLHWITETEMDSDWTDYPATKENEE